MRRIWLDLVEAYRFIGYWTPVAWFALRWSGERNQPWWALLLGSLAWALAIYSTYRDHELTHRPEN